MSLTAGVRDQQYNAAPDAKVEAHIGCYDKYGELVFMARKKFLVGSLSPKMKGLFQIVGFFAAIATILTVVVPRTPAHSIAQSSSGPNSVNVGGNVYIQHSSIAGTPRDRPSENKPPVFLSPPATKSVVQIARGIQNVNQSSAPTGSIVQIADGVQNVNVSGAGGKVVQFGAASTASGDAPPEQQ